MNQIIETLQKNLWILIIFGFILLFWIFFLVRFFIKRKLRQLILSNSSLIISYTTPYETKNISGPIKYTRDGDNFYGRKIKFKDKYGNYKNYSFIMSEEKIRTYFADNLKHLPIGLTTVDLHSVKQRIYDNEATVDLIVYQNNSGSIRINNPILPTRELESIFDEFKLETWLYYYQYPFLRFIIDFF